MIEFENEGMRSLVVGIVEFLVFICKEGGKFGLFSKMGSKNLQKWAKAQS